MKLELVELALKQDRQTCQQCKFELDGPRGSDTIQTPTMREYCSRIPEETSLSQSPVHGQDASDGKARDTSKEMGKV
jgi:hypothetical protein